MQLTIPIHRHHFEAILCGDKTIEYRDKSPYWYSRLAFRKYSTARIVNGRNTKSQWMTCQITEIIEKDDCFEIHLGPVLDFGNLDKISGLMIQNTDFKDVLKNIKSFGFSKNDFIDYLDSKVLITPVENIKKIKGMYGIEILNHIDHRQIYESIIL
jgi:hypothetical protein